MVTDLHREVKIRLNDGTVESTLRKAVGQSYPIFHDTLVRVKVNDLEVEKNDIPFGGSSEVEPGIETFEEQGVKVTLLATLAPKEQRAIRDSPEFKLFCT